MPMLGHHDQLFQALDRAGISKSYVQKMLPDWWTEELMADPSARVELDINLSRMFGLKLSNLLLDRPKVTFDLPNGTKFKRSHRIAEGELAQATSIIHSIAKMVALCVPQAISEVENDPLALRQIILSGRAKRVSMMALVDYLWRHGIPTIHVDQIPAGMKKMDGMVLQVMGRPIVVLCKRSSYAAWQLFILAHELGHIGLRHIEPDEILVDCTMGEESYLLDEKDPEEIASDQFAIALLNGAYETRYTTNVPPRSASLVKAAIEYQNEHAVDAGHIILNYGFHKKAWPVAQAALQRLDSGNAPHTINKYFFDHANFGALPESSVEFLLKMTGMDSGLEFVGTPE